MKKIVLLLSCIALLSACRKDDEGFDNMVKVRKCPVSPTQ